MDIANAQQPKNVFIASDHGGFRLKEYLTGELTKLGYKITDFGPNEYDPSDDYPDTMMGLSLAWKRCRELSSTVADSIPQPPILDKDYQLGDQKSNGRTLAIVICRNGVGVSILANKIDGVRCALSFSTDHARSARRDDDANFLALPADYITKEVALQTTLAFLETPFSNEERHVRRLKKLEEIASLRSQ